MPELDFVLPHWLYWGGLLLFPLIAALLYRTTRRRATGKPVSLQIAYLFLVTGGFIGVHRLYLKSRWAVVFMVLLVAVLEINFEARFARDDLSAANNAVSLAELKIRRAERAIEKAERRLEARESSRTERKLEEARTELSVAQLRREEALAERAQAETVSSRWNTMAAGLAGIILLLLLVDAALLPGLVRKRNALEQPPRGEGFQCPAVEREHDDSREPFLFNRLISRLNGFAGEFVAYWSLIAVFVYYYEVIARYVFNSPTNWAHEAMFLMFGMQYLIAGGFCLRENAHVRVDVIYTHLSKRTQAIFDIVSSTFFFIFVVTLLVTGWIFFYDAYRINEVSFTEWGIQYWPVKFALPLGAALLLLQGIAQLVKDIAVVVRPGSTELDTRVRPEG